jgi:hypothetical protein
MDKKDRNKPVYEWIEVNAGEVYYRLSAHCLENEVELNGWPGFFKDGYYRPVDIKIKPKKSFKVYARKIKNGYTWNGWNRCYIKIDYDISVNKKTSFSPTYGSRIKIQR